MHHLHLHLGLKNPVLCVEPSEEMIQCCNGRQGVVGVFATATEFFQSHQNENELHCNKVRQDNSTLITYDQLPFGLVALLVCIGDLFRRSWVRIPTELEIFFSFSVWSHFISRATAWKEKLGILIQHFNLPHLNH